MKLLIFLLINLIFLQSCRKESRSLAYYRLEDTALELIRLNQGSYYIYRDSATSQLDSVIVSESRLELKKLYSMPSQDIYHADYLKLALKKVNASGVSNDWLSAETTPGYEFYLFSGYPVSGQLLFFFPFWSRQNIYELKPVATIEGTNYTNVHCFTQPHGSTCWWVKGIGIIKLSYYTSGLQTFFLVRRG